MLLTQHICEYNPLLYCQVSRRTNDSLSSLDAGTSVGLNVKVTFLFFLSVTRLPSHPQSNPRGRKPKPRQPYAQPGRVQPANSPPKGLWQQGWWWL